MAVPVQTGSTFSAGLPRQLFSTRYVSGGTRSYDVSADGKRFLMEKNGTSAAASDRPSRIVIVQNWLDELKRQVPAN